ncbi:MAG: Uma2 family endonuclease [Hydrogenovibrio sp.]|uniref:Uma2 family endonuclease n=1 Tax=Hydrogenovibrio sp. TaxID=2065821 RepID=UPI0028703664|nr:Uma2 family endonuclease [Hydrogenovibrio sp.]MDR9498678.1 Uma2 family endonuclease [Hydrogenovibrio sp.]
MSTTYREHYTRQDHQNWEGDWELIDGAPYAMSPSPGFSHQRLEKALLIAIDHILKQCDRCEAVSEIDWSPNEDTVVRPDVLVVCDQTGEFVRKTPELIAEVVSPTSAFRDEKMKFELYQQEGVKTYLLVYPEERRVKIFRWHEGRLIKDGDYANETITLEIQDCQGRVDLSQLWRKP